MRTTNSDTKSGFANLCDKYIKKHLYNRIHSSNPLKKQIIKQFPKNDMLS